MTNRSGPAARPANTSAEHAEPERADPARTRNGLVEIDPRGAARMVRALDRPPTASPRLDIRLLVPALAAWAMVAATLALSWQIRLCLAGGGVLIAALLAWRGRPRHRRWHARLMLAALSAAVVGLTVGAAAAADARRRSGPLPEWISERAVVRVTAMVAGEPIDVGHGRILVRVRASRVVARGLSSAVSARLLVVGDVRWSAVRWRQEVALVGRLGPGDDGSAELAVVRALGPPIVGPDRSATGWTASVREALRGAVAALPPDGQGLVPAMVVGDTSRSPPDLIADMRTTGLTHLSAVSGANISILLAAIAPLIRWARIPRRARPIAFVVVVAAFVAVARPEPSVLRAAVMGTIGLLAVYRATRASGIPALAAAVVAMLVVDPWLARSPGFALSVLATLGLLLFVRPWAESLEPHVLPRLRPALPALLVPLAAQVTCAPIIVLLQGSVSVVGIPANLLAAIFVAPVTIAGAGLALAGMTGLAPAAAAWLAGLPALAIAQIAHRGARVSWASAPWPEGPRGAWLMTALVALALVCGPRLTYAVRHHPVPWLGCGLLTGALLAPVGSLAWPPPWQFVACDVGQGDALVLRTGEQSAILVDAGPEPSAVDRCLRQLNVRRLDAIVLTHFHADHIAGLSGALAGRQVGTILVSPVADPTQGANEVAAQAQARSIPVRSVRVGEVITAGSVTATVWWPGRRILDGSVPNNASIVLDAHVAGLDLFLSGDIEREAGHALWRAVSGDPALRSRLSAYDVVKLPHHGSSNLDPSLMGLLRAPLMVVSVGADNDYGHPSPGALAWVQSTGARLLRTDEDGDIAVWLGHGRLTTRTHH